MRMRPDVRGEGAFEPIEMTLERHFPGDRNGAATHGVQLTRVGEHVDEGVGERGGAWWIGRHEMTVDARPEPLAHAADVEGHGWYPERRRLKADKTEGLGPGTWHGEHARPAEPPPALVAAQPPGRRTGDTSIQGEALPDR